MPTAETTPTCAAPKTRGFALPCIKCGEVGASIQLSLNEITADDAIHCNECDADYGLDDVREALAAWSPLLAWCDMAPELPVAE